jgi:tripeptidyl-peptidase-1
MIFSISSNALMALLTFVNPAVASLPRAHSRYAIKDSHPVPRRWERVGPAPAQHLVQLQIGLKQNNFKELERLLYEGK